MKNLMVIQHEVMEVLRSREKDRSKSKDEAGKSWTIMKSLDLVCNGGKVGLTADVQAFCLRPSQSDQQGYFRGLAFGRAAEE